mgnify:FL=1|jgi:threonine/homoserine/homoserine lactone efflux protein
MVGDSAAVYLAMGAFFGLTAGISPGPLLALVISETLKHNRKEGFKIAVAPLITDLPIIFTTYLLFSKFSKYNLILAVISFLGGLYFLYLGIETTKTEPHKYEITAGKINTLRKGIVANFLNPNPYIFWFTAGIPTAYRAFNISITTAILYFLLFYIMLTGSKICVAILAEKSRNFLKARVYSTLMKILGAILIFFALMFIYDGIRIVSEMS